jgi:hypothetical protein
MNSSNFIYVHPDFKKRLKIDASMKGLTVIKYTKELSNVKSLEEEFKENKVKSKVFNLRF